MIEHTPDIVEVTVVRHGVLLLRFADGLEGEVEVLGRMNAAIVHRGPDEDGVFIDEHCSLAMRRLSIIDLAGGKQPMHITTSNPAVGRGGAVPPSIGKF